MARITSTPLGEARCAHRDTWGSVCKDCFNTTPFLTDVYEFVYVMNGTEWLDGDIAGTVSPATPKVEVIDLTDLAKGDTILGYTKTPRTAPVVAEVVLLPGGSGVVTTKGERFMLCDTKVVVVRATNGNE